MGEREEREREREGDEAGYSAYFSYVDTFRESCRDNSIQYSAAADERAKEEHKLQNVP